MEYNLLEKTDLWITGLKLNNADLNQIALAVSNTLGLKKEEVLVTDVRDDYIIVDILRKVIDAKNILGKKNELFERLDSVDGVSTSPDTSIHSEGILGFIELDEDQVERTIAETEKMSNQILQNVSKRVIIFSTGFEIDKKMIMERNSQDLYKFLKGLGYKVTLGGNLPDDRDKIAYQFSDSIERGFGLIITTGGVGAEDKDQTIEALLKIDPRAATPYIVKYHRDRRHVKEGVRVGVGTYGISKIICLPGPNDEVNYSLKTLEYGLSGGLDKEKLASEIAQILRDKIRNKSNHPIGES